MVVKSKTRRAAKKKATVNKQKQSIRVRFISKSSPPNGGASTSSSSSSAGGGGAGASTVVIQPQPTLPPPSTSLPPASPLGRPPPDIEPLRQAILRLERANAQQQKDFQDRVNQVAATLTGNLNNSTQGVRDQLFQHINKISADTGAHLGDLRQAINDANARTDSLRQGSDDFASQVSQQIGGVAQGVQQNAANTEQLAANAAIEIARANQRIVGLQQENGVIGNAVLQSDAARQTDAQVLASELVRTQQGLINTQQQGVDIANDLHRRVAQTQAGVVALQGETGALGNAVMDIDRRVADNAQLTGAELTDLIQGVADGRYMLQDLDARVRRAYHEGVAVAGNLQTQIDGLGTPQGPGDGNAGGLAAMSGGHTTRHGAGVLQIGPPGGVDVGDDWGAGGGGGDDGDGGAGGAGMIVAVNRRRTRDERETPTEPTRRRVSFDPMTAPTETGLVGGGVPFGQDPFPGTPRTSLNEVVNAQRRAEYLAMTQAGVRNPRKSARIEAAAQGPESDGEDI